MLVKDGRRLSQRAMYYYSQQWWYPEFSIGAGSGALAPTRQNEEGQMELASCSFQERSSELRERRLLQWTASTPALPSRGRYCVFLQKLSTFSSKVVCYTHTPEKIVRSQGRSIPCSQEAQRQVPFCHHTGLLNSRCCEPNSSSLSYELLPSCLHFIHLTVLPPLIVDFLTSVHQYRLKAEKCTKINSKQISMA